MANHQKNFILQEDDDSRTGFLAKFKAEIFDHEVDESSKETMKRRERRICDLDQTTVTREASCKEVKAVMSTLTYLPTEYEIGKALRAIADDIDKHYYLKSPHSTHLCARHKIAELLHIIKGLTQKNVIVVEEPVPLVCKSPKELDKVQKLNLRTSVQTVTSKTVELKQFDPNFFSHANIWCRYPGCKQRRSRQCKFDGSKTSKEDLYLCPSHRSNLEDYIAKMCAQKGIKFYTNSENINTYTSKIGLLESAYNLLTKQTPLITGSPRAAILLQEVFLNLRNYFLIVNTLLNPDDENVELALPAVMSVLERILQLLGDREYSSAMLLTLVGLIDLLKQLLNIILFSFGVIYSWVYQSLTVNPGAQIGAGLGGFLVASKIGFDAARQAFGASLLAVIVGGVTCGLIGGGLYNGACKILSREDERFRDYRQFVQATNCDQLEADQEQQEMPPEEETPVYYLKGNSMGDLTLAVLSRFMFPVN